MVQKKNNQRANHDLTHFVTSSEFRTSLYRMISSIAWVVLHNQCQALDTNILEVVVLAVVTKADERVSARARAAIAVHV